jgi:ABC-2 type transport system permease protein
MTNPTDTPARPAPAAAEPRGSVLTDVRNVWWRETLTALRDPFSLIFSLDQPLVFLALFLPLLSGVAGTVLLGGSSLPPNSGGTTLQWFVPGVLVVITMFGTSMTGSNLQFEIMTGAFERILATPVSRPALMIGRALKELTPLVVQSALIVLLTVPFGFVLYPLHALAGLLMLRPPRRRPGPRPRQHDRRRRAEQRRASQACSAASSTLPSRWAAPSASPP